MPDYSQGKIYKIWDNGFKKCYIGSTCESLSQRMARHRTKYKSWKEGKPVSNVTAYSLFDEFGIDNCKIVEVEKYPCNDKNELFAREGFYIKNDDCINKFIAGRTDKEYYQDNKEYLLQKAQDYRDNHREESKEYFKQRYIEKKEEISKNKKEHRQTNLEKVREQERQAYQRNKAVKQRPYTCQCGATMCFSAKSRHEKTQKHQQYLKSLEQSNPQE